MDVSVAELQKKKIEVILRYISKFCLVLLHKGEFFQRCQEPEALIGALVFPKNVSS
jgi:hypothetical protein